MKTTDRILSRWPRILTPCILYLSGVIAAVAATTTLTLDNIVYSLNSDTRTATVTGSSGATGAVVLRSAVTGSDGVDYPVVAIGASAFSGNSTVTSLTIPSTVTTIASGAFYNCKGLKELVLEDGTTPLSLGYSSSSNTYNGQFYSCPLATLHLGRDLTFTADAYYRTPFYGCSLTSVTVGDKVTYLSKELFYEQNKLESVRLGAALDSIGNYAFYHTNLKAVALPSKVRTVGTYAFYTNNSMTELSLPAAVRAVGGYAFRMTPGAVVSTPDAGAWAQIDFAGAQANPAVGGTLKEDGRVVREVRMPAGVRGIGSYAFYGNENIESVTMAGSQAATVGASAFAGCTNLAAVSFSDATTSIGASAFEKCSKLTRLTLPVRLATLGASAFAGCTALSEVTIPATLTTVNSKAFGGCTALSRVNVGDLTAWCRIKFGSTDANPTYYAGGLTHDGSAVTSLALPYGLSEVPTYAFYNCKNLTSVSIPETVTTIGTSAFYGCAALQSPTSLPASVTKIGSTAFSGCAALRSMSLPTGLTSVGTNAFAGCTSLTAFYLSSSNANYTVQGGVLYDKAVTSVVAYPGGMGGMWRVPETMTQLKSGTIVGADALTAVSIHAAVTSIDTGAFQQCGSLMNFYVDSGNPYYYTQDGVLIYGYSTSYSTYGPYVHIFPSGRTSYVFPGNMYGSSTGAFRYATKLKELTFEAGEGAAYCNAGYYPSSGSGDTRGAFYYCPLEKVTFNREVSYPVTGPYSARYWSPFTDVTTLKTVVLGEGITELPDYLFYGCTALDHVVIPDYITSIGYYAFRGCTSLSDLQIGSGVTRVGGYAFVDTPFHDALPVVSGIRYAAPYIAASYDGTTPNVVVRDGTTVLAEYLMYKSTAVTSLTLPDGITTMPRYALNGCNALETIKWPATLTTIADHSIIGIAVKDLVIPASVTRIDSWNLSNFGDGRLETLTIEDGDDPLHITYNKNYSYYYGALYNCSRLNHIYVGRNITSEYGLFWYTYDSHPYRNDGSYDYPLTVEVGDKVTKLYKNMFHNCTKLSSVVLGAGVQTIESGAFYGIAPDVHIVSKAPQAPVFSASDVFKADTYAQAAVTIPYEGVGSYVAADYWPQFANMTWATDHCVIDERTVGASYDVPLRGHSERLDYVRQWNNTAWQPLFVPFEIDVDELSDNYDVAYISNFHQYDNDGDGVPDETVMEAFRQTDGTIAANTPYLIRARQQGLGTITLHDVAHAPALPDSIDCGSTLVSYLFRGTYDTISSADLHKADAYVLGGGQFVRAAEGTVLKPFRWFLTTDAYGSYLQNAAQKLRLAIHDEDYQPEGVAAPYADAQDEAGPVYDLAGRRTSPSRAAGIYIRKGEKPFVRP